MAFNIMGSVHPELNNAPVTLDVSLIDCDNDNFFAREDVEKEQKRIELLSEEIQEVGFHSVIEVRPVNNRYQVIAGETRLKAMQLAYQQTKDPQYQFIPCFINNSSEIHTRRRLIMDNILQRELTPSLKMKAIEELQKTYQQEKAEGKKLPGRITYLIAQDIGLGKSQVGTYQKVINNGSEALKEKIGQEEITVDAAAKLSSLPAPAQKEFLDQSNDYSLKSVKDYVDQQAIIEAKSSSEYEELDIYEYIDDPSEDYYIESEDQNDESIEDDGLVHELTEHDIKVLKKISIDLDFVINLREGRLLLHTMNDKKIANAIEVKIEEIQDLLEDFIDEVENYVM